MSWIVAETTGSALLVASVWVLNLLPWLGLPFYGLLGDRWPRRRIVRMADGSLIALSLATAALTFGGHLPPALALVWTACYATLAAIARPAVKGIIREVSSQAANLVARMTSLEYVVLGLGQFLAAVVLLQGNPAAAFAVVALLLGLALLALGRTGAAEPRTAPAPLWGPVLAEMAQLRRLIATTIVCGACTFTVRALAPLLALRNLHTGVLGFAALGAAYSLGAALGASRFHGRSALRWLPAAVGVLVAGTTGSAAWAIAAFTAIGVAAGSQDALNSGRVAAELPGGAQSRGMAVMSLVWRVPGLLAGAIAGYAGLSPRVLVVLAGLTGMAALWAGLSTGSAASASG